MRFYLFCFLFVLPHYCFAVCPLDEIDDDAVLPTLNAMTLEEKVGQLFIVNAYPNKRLALQKNQQAHPVEYIETMVREYHVGGVLFLELWDPIEERAHIVHYRSLKSKVPLLLAQDLEWGLNMRMPSTLRFPKNMTLGAVQDNTLIYEMGKEIANHVSLFDIDVNFSPVFDVNTNPDNPIIGDRSFGEDSRTVAKKGVAMVKGLQEGVAACAKHSPGHGDTSVDSHNSLPTISLSAEEIVQHHMAPFKEAIDAGVLCIMAAHIACPSIDSTPNLPASLSPKITKNFLRDQFGFRGVIITDHLEMGAIVNHWSPQEVALLAFKAGNDLLLCQEKVPEYVDAILTAIRTQELSEAELNEKVLRILKLKTWCAKKKSIQKRKIDYTRLDFLKSREACKLKRKLYRSALTVPKKSLPLPKISAFKNPLLVQVGGSSNALFVKKMRESIPTLECVYLPVDSSSALREHVLEEMQKYPATIVALLGMERGASSNFGISSDLQAFLREASAHSNTCFVLFGSPYALKHFTQPISCLVAYEDDEEAQNQAAHVLLGKLSPQGRLPVLIEKWDK